MFRKYCVVQFLESSKLILPEMQTQCSFKTPSATDACHHHGVEVAKQMPSTILVCAGRVGQRYTVEKVLSFVLVV